MDGQDLLTRIQERGHLHGANQTRRAVQGVLGVLRDMLPTPAFRRLTAHLPADLHPAPPAAGTRPIEVLGCRAFVARVAARLLLEEPDAAFLARVVFEHLNTATSGATPATIAHLVAADLRPLVRAGVTRALPATPQLRITLPAPATATAKRVTAVRH
ncbi:DUF2267 domain-containing protein [Couchioplanes caeruleus]|uniref:DUF2267 domain-containing protein n=1 Tax=Couchioplanes caeruleus TaxID=56438 RepID=UPI0020BFB307|nr:DUF2267 domain-containing protein [Couchioplanes caeruleus]UQU62373.1 DUF2267 domain-containing protein [Couchioplanes caeruleus]